MTRDCQPAPSLRFLARLLLTVAMLVAAPSSVAIAAPPAMEYCAQNTRLVPNVVCFDSMDAAEDYVKAESPTGDPVGRHLLEQQPQVTGFQSGEDVVIIPYRVKDVAVGPVDGELFKYGPVPGGGGLNRSCPGPGLPYLSKLGCVTEAQMTDYILSNDQPVSCSRLEGGWLPSSGPYAWGERTPLGGSSQWGFRGLVWSNLNRFHPDNRKLVYAHFGDCPTPQQALNVYTGYGKDTYQWCPPFYRGAGSTWPVICMNGEYGQITVKLKPICGDRIGNPCVPSTGAKIETDNDIQWGRLGFSRTYNSLRQFQSSALLGQGWSHSYAMRLWATSGPNGSVYIQSAENALESFRFVSADRYTSKDVSGLIVDKYPTSVAPAPRWILRKPSGEQWHFSETGSLVAIRYADSPLDDLALTYCSFADFKNGLCAVFGALVSVTDARGRWLHLEYRPTRTVPAAPGQPINPYATPEYERLVSVSSDAGMRVSYEYDAMNRLIRATSDPYGTPSTRTYLYGEAANLCNNGSGTVTTPCSNPGRTLLTGKLDENGLRFLNVTYDKTGRVTSSSHPNNADKVVLTYPSATQTTVTMPSGEVRTYNYGTQPFRRLMSLVRNVGLIETTTSYTYSTLGGTADRVATITDARGFETEYGYDAFRQTSRTEAKKTPLALPEQRTMSSTWDDALNRPLMQTLTNATGQVESLVRYAYNSRGQVAARCQIDPADGAAMAYACSATNAPLGSAKVRRWVYTYCEVSDVAAPNSTCPILGLPRSTNGPRDAADVGMGGVDDTTTFVYRSANDPNCAAGGTCTYRKGDLWKVVNALGHTTETVSYDGNGRPTRTKDSNSTITDLTYHPRGWLLSRSVRANANGVASSDDATTTFAYDATGSVTRVTMPDGVFLDYVYDPAHRLTDIVDTLGNRLHYALDNAGNRVKEETFDASYNPAQPGVGLKRSLARTVNALNRITRSLNAQGLPTRDSSSFDDVAGKIQDGYDANGNPVDFADGLNTRTRQEYDPLNRLTKTIEDYAGSDSSTSNTMTKFAYDARDNLRTVTDPGTTLDPNGLQTSYLYDGLNNLAQLSSPDTGPTAYAYDKAGNRIRQTDNRGVTSIYTYDALNRLRTIEYPTSALNVSFAYEQKNSGTGCSISFPAGRLTQILDSSGSTTYCYDRRGNVLSKTQVTAGTTYVVRYTYDKADRLSSLTYPSGGTAYYTRDAVGRVNAVSYRRSPLIMAAPVVSNATYYPFGPLNVLTYGNGRTLTKIYDQDFAIDRIASSHPDGLVLDLTSNVMGNIVAASSTIGASPPTRSYQYDRLHRLVDVNTGINADVEAFAYNRTGDRISKTLPGQAAQVYTYLSGSHRLGAVDGATRLYDQNGNTIARGNEPTFSYDDRNRLAAAQWTLATGNVNFDYNGRGERVLKASESVTEAGHRFVYDESGRLLGDYGDDTSTDQQYIYLDGAPVALAAGNALSYIETDHLGTPRVVADSSTNAWQWHWDYMARAFGEHAPATPTTGGIDLPLRYPGQFFDSESGLHYNYFRDYEAGTGRYLESDPIGLRGGISTYGYVRGQPTRLTDRKGLESPTYALFGRGPILTEKKCRCFATVNEPFGIGNNDRWGPTSSEISATEATTNNYLPDVGLTLQCCCKDKPTCANPPPPAPFTTFLDQPYDTISVSVFRAYGISAQPADGGELCVTIGTPGFPVNLSGPAQ